MKRILGRTWIIYVFVIAFISGLLLLTFRTVTNAQKWVDKPYNGHIVINRKNARTGKIYDRNGKALVSTSEKKRKYINDQDVRKALLHVVGDDTRNISTAVLSRYNADLLDYSFIWGLDMPKSFRKSADNGGDVTLTIDAETCKVAYNALKNYDSGACVIYNYKTGEIICDVSTKTYDPKNPPTITEDNESEWEGVYLDNALSSTYSPGSIFKIVTTAAALENITEIDGVKLEEYVWHCTGSHNFGGNDVTCVGADGDVNLEQAFKQSCNYVFADLAVRVGTEKMNETARKMGINASFDVSGIKTAAGHYDVSGSDIPDLAWSGVGQSTDQVNPIQMMTICGAIANGGTPVSPYLIASDDGSMIKDSDVENNGSYGDSLLSPATAAKLQQYMRTASQSYSENYPNWYVDGLTLCAKTGTAQIQNNLQNGWIVGFSQDEDCPLAFACVVHKISDDIYGLGTAGNIAAQALAQAKQIYK